MSRSTTTRLPDPLPDPQPAGGLMTGYERELSETGFISGRASVHFALYRNGIEDLAEWEHTTQLPVIEQEPDELTLWQGFAFAGGIAAVTIVWLLGLVWAASVLAGLF